MTSLTFYGAAETVTGSKYLLEAGGTKILIDCGLFQGLKELRQKNWETLPFAAKEVAAVVLTHAHIDHTGYLPRFVQSGFRNPVFATGATVELTKIMLLDAAENQEEDADYARRKGFSKHTPAKPLYNRADATAALKLLRAVRRGEWFCPAEPFWVRYSDAGHLLGSTSIELEVRQGPKPLRVVFSGDVGRYGAPLYHDPQSPPACDYLICESTYGNRDHPHEPIAQRLAEVVRAALARGGVILIPAFAVGRAQQLIFLLELLIATGQIPEIPIYLDSPMALNATEIYLDYADEMDDAEFRDAAVKVPVAPQALRAKNVHLIRTVDESKRLNSIKNNAVIISSSGMMVGGRILHHLKQRLPQPQNTVVLGGFMAAGTRGRQLQEGAASLRIHGQSVPVRSAVVEASGLSGHADRGELMRWLQPMPAPRRTFLTHGELESARAFSELLVSQRQWNVTIPKLGERVELEATS